MNFTPKQICDELDKFIIGQSKAKKTVAVALRNRYRRSKISPELREEITPKNIIMTGPTGVGKTEIARRLAKLVCAPFVKIEATKYTEVGYVGRDVESMIRDLVEVSVRMVKEENKKEVELKAKENVDKILIDAIYISKKAQAIDVPSDVLKKQVKEGYQERKFEDEFVEVEVVESVRHTDMGNAFGIEVNLTDMLGGLFPSKKKRRKMLVKDAREALINDEADKLIDQENVNIEAIRRAEQDGIIFIDEIDKIASSSGIGGNAPEVSREGVQRDILPIIEGSTVSTKYGSIKTDFILFIAAGAFHVSKIDDLIPELQGRFPIRVALDNLTKKDFLAILTQPENAIVKQYQQLLEVENINLIFEADALKEIAEIAERENETSQNIGARRLHAIMEQLLEDISFNASWNETKVDVVISKAYVDNIFRGNIKQYDLSKYVL